ncbi:hypothetical protein McpSp1_16110 [Methanocorpusculaceae archaeon Sp1]|nr:hypothetical protein [Methanocorpusculaceae archaeon Sp1]
MEKKSIAILLGVIIIFICLFIGGQYLFSQAEESLDAHPTGYTDQNPPPERIHIRNLTEEDFSKYPALQTVIIDDNWITITDDPFLILKVGDSHLSKVEAGEILAEFGISYLYWNKTYYSLMRVVT